MNLIYYNPDMTQADTIFTPKDNSLEERIKAYRSVVGAWYNAEASLKAMDNDEWSHTLGEKEEIVKAHDIILNSLDTASKEISLNEMKQAKELGLLSDSEAQEFINNSRQEEIQKIHRNRQKSNSSKDRQR
ncbi:MAG: hypothetical protein OQL19_12270 [Gammaproteobacteria bacterium]|nr:hypothetical protein [Gammaproteobacteria bacterium]